MVKLTNFTPSRTSPRPGSLHPSTRLDRAVPTAEQSDGASTNTMAGPRVRLPVWLSAVILLAAPPRGPKRFRGEEHLVRWVQVGIAGRVAQQTAAADAQNDVEADGRSPARPVDAVRGHLGQHGRKVVFWGQ